MLYFHKELIKKLKSDYQIQKAVSNKKYYKIEKGLYSDKEFVNPLEIILKKYPNAIFTSDSAYYYYCIRKSSCSHKKDKENILQEIRLWYNVVDVLKKYSLYEIFYDDVINFLNKHMVLGIERASSYEFVVQKYLLSNVDKFINKKIVIWGAGSVGKSYYSQLCRYSDITIIAWIDKCLDKNTYNCMTISKPEIIEQLDYDYIIIAIKDYNNAKKIYEEIGSYGVKNEKVFWEKPMFIV